MIIGMIKRIRQKVGCQGEQRLETIPAAVLDGSMSEVRTDGGGE